MLLILFFLACFGVTNIITGGKIFEPLRKSLARIAAPVVIFECGEEQVTRPANIFWRSLAYWIKCPMCIGVPVGVSWRLIGLFPNTSLGFWRELVIAGFVSSAVCWVMRVVLARLGEDLL